MSNRDLARRLVRLESNRQGRGIRYDVSDRPLSDEERQADGNWSLEDDGLQPIMTIEEWETEFCTDGH